MGRVEVGEGAPVLVLGGIGLGPEPVCRRIAGIEHDGRRQVGDRRGVGLQRQFGEPAGRVLDPASRRLLQEVQVALRCLSVHDYVGGRRHTWLLIPIEADGIGFDIQNLPHVLGLKQPNMRGAVTLDEITASDATRRQIREFAPDADVFTLWEFPNFDNKVGEIAKQLGLTGPLPRGGANDLRAPHLKVVR